MRSVPYPASPTCPELTAPLLQHVPKVVQPAGYRQLLIPNAALAAASMAHVREVFVTSFQDIALVTAGGPEALCGDSVAVSPRLGVRLTSSRLPAGLQEQSLLLIGKGYLLLMPSRRGVADFKSVPTLPLPNKQELATSKAPVPSRRGLAWHILLKTHGERKHLTVSGKLWEVAGFGPQSPTRITRHADGLLIERVEEQRANGRLTYRPSAGGKAYPYFRIGPIGAASIEGDAVRMIAMDGAVALVGMSRPLSDFGLEAREAADNVPVATKAAADAGPFTPAEDSEEPPHGWSRGSVAVGGVRLMYPALASWPRLAKPEAVVLRADSQGCTSLRVPMRTLRAAGLEPRQGLNIATFEGRALIWAGNRGGMFSVTSEGGFVVNHVGLSPEVTPAKHALVQGPGYVILTTEEDARKLARGLEPTRLERNPRVDDDVVDLVSAPYPTADAVVLAWKDCKVTDATGNRLAILAGLIWKLAGIELNDPLAFTRYTNVTMIRRGNETSSKTLRPYDQTRSDMPRQFVGTTLFDVASTEVVRAIVTRDGILLTTPDSELGRQCKKAQRIPLGSLRIQRFVSRHEGAAVQGSKAPTASIGGLTVPLHAPSGKNTSLYDLPPGESRIQVQGAWLADYGFVPGARFELVPHPLMPSRRLARLNACGPHMVTTHTGNTPKLYVPAAAVADFDSEKVKVFGAADGLHIQRHFVNRPHVGRPRKRSEAAVAA
nr:hypothetical protein [uncultured bacterium]